MKSRVWTIGMAAIFAPLVALAEPPAESCVILERPSVATTISDWISTHIKGRDPVVQRTEECLAKVVDPEFAGTSQEGFVLTLTSNERLNHSLHESLALRKFLFHDPDLKPVLSTPELKSYRKIIAHGPSIRFLLSEPAGVREGYSIGQHTIRVLNVYDAQKSPYKIKEIVIAGIRDVEDLVRFTLTLHDIGKSIAVRSGDKSREEKFSVPVATRLMESAGFNDREIHLASILIREHQSIGGFLQGKRSLERTEKTIRLAAEEMNIPVEQMFRLFEIVFVSDAGSYPYLQKNIFTINQAGQLTPMAESYKTLTALFVQRGEQ